MDILYVKILEYLQVIFENFVLKTSLSRLNFFEGLD